MTASKNEEKRNLRTFREWELRLPQVGTPEWTQLLKLVLGQAAAEWDEAEQLLMTQLVSTAESKGGEEVGYLTYNAETEKFEFVTLAHVYLATDDRKEVFFSPEHYRVALEATDLEVDRNPIRRVITSLERYDDIPDPGDQEQLITAAIMALEKIRGY